MSSGYSSVFCGQLDFDKPKTSTEKKPMTQTELTTNKPVYTSTKHVLKEQGQISQNEEGIRRLNGKYESPGNVMTQLPTGFSTGIPLNGVEIKQHAAVSPTLALSPNMIYNGNSAMSDGSSELSWHGSSEPGNNVFAEGVQEHDLLQVEMFYRSHKTEVTVGKCLANLYFGSAKQTDVEKWDFANTGIPLLVLDTGEHHRNRKLTFILAEKGTGFTLWKDSIDHLTKYSSPSSNFHTMHVSTDHTKLAGLSFDDTNAASEFFNFIQTITGDPEDDLLNLSKKKKKKKEKKEKKPKFKPPKRSDISQPCCFVHVTKLEPPELIPPPSRDSVNELSAMISNKLDIPRSESSEISEDSSSHTASERL
ncbi:uncharacterized protein LOC126810206 [Patella vulgata]|uniref:uncharacterized protein LOC126810206 n=1 Tax=Patella vulgata TaxID=6465 RepID=UPI00218081C2|nr:uncharacterized protein LOC126810206 [Patella vulgata]XP_050391112.1 uncharacterized protein LOC126810206 [Patella vulgata]XP_050391113.1 uncharacterized protein LOC126810206 [Patella vulgata]XP_050391114.1 uncharacterized protein LOC126810206 [Patella vulgata]XP_050391115.1 uncharacterized protein LOC126810206 [Patella vulgata]